MLELFDYKKIKDKLGSGPVPKLTVSKPAPVLEFKVGDGLNPSQTNRAQATIETAAFRQASDTANTPLIYAKNAVTDIGRQIKTEFSIRKEPVPVRRMFEAEPIQTNLPPIVTQLGTLGYSIVEAIPKFAATLYAETIAPDRKTGKVNLGFNAKRLGYEDTTYPTAVAEIQKKIKTGMPPAVATLQAVSEKVLDVAFGAQLTTQVLSSIEKQLLKGSIESKIGAWETLGRPTTIDEANLNKINQTQQAFESVKDLPEPEKVRIVSKLNNTLNKAVNLLNKKGVPTTAEQIKYKVGKVAEVGARETPITEFYDPKLNEVKSYPERFAKPDIKLKSPATESIEGVKQLPGYRERPGQAPAFGLSTKEVESVGYEGEKDLSTKILDDLKGKTTVSKQYILDATNRGELKLVEKELTRNILESIKGDKVNVKEFAAKIKHELLPLKRNSLSAGQQRYEDINLPGNLRGPVKNYFENIYESPIKTSAGNTHFSSTSNENYFGHTRAEDLADDKTRKIIEVQSDLYQKGNLGREEATVMSDNLPDNIKNSYKEFFRKMDGLYKEKSQLRLKKDTPATLHRIDEIDKELTPLEEKAAKIRAERNKELAKLSQYNDPTAHFRMVREEIKKAAQDGKTKLQFPTGETAMQIEGIGDHTNWFYGPELKETLTPDKLKVGLEVGDPRENTSYIVTDVLGDGKFKAVPKNYFEDRLNAHFVNEGLAKKGFGTVEETAKEKILRQVNTDNSVVETFDISGKIDTNNPIYKFYNKELGSYLKNKYGAEVITDERGVTWWEVDVKKEYADIPVQAFGAAAGLEQDDDGKLRFNPLKAAFGVAGFSLMKKSGAIDAVEKLIAEGKARIVQSAGKDIFQIKQGEKWVKAENNQAAVEWAARQAKEGKDFGPRNNDAYRYDPYAKKAEVLESSTPSKIDELIQEGKARVIRVNNRDTYQIKKGDNWLTVRDENSAIKQLTEKYVAKPKVYSKGDQEKLDYTRAMLENVRESLADHPARSLLKFIDKKEGQFEDFKNPDLASTEFKRNQIIEKNKKIMYEAEKSFADHPELSDKFDNADTIKDVIADYANQRNIEKTLVASKNDLEKNLIPLSEISPSNNPLALRLPPRSPSLIDTTEGPGRSIEIQALQAKAILDGEPFLITSSLPDIIESTVTPVKRKVNIIDTYLTSPERVMHKIGFGKEYNMLREGQDAYWKELPKNIDKITEWAQRASGPYANEEIFKYLDGEAITLNPNEKKVALEIKDWLKEWAKRLKLPEDDTIGRYITHIFDEELMAKEFDEELAKIITDKVPGQVYDPFLLKRLGKKGYIQDTWRALDAYVKRATRKVHIDPALEVIQDKAGAAPEYSQLEKTQFKYIQRYIENVNMRPGETEEGLDNFIKSTFIGYRFGQRPTAKISRFFRQATYRGLIGGNISSAMRNLSQGANTYAVLGEKHTAIGYAKLFNKGTSEELAREGVLNSGFVQDRVLSSGKKALQKLDKGLFFFFNVAERINRGAAYFGAKSKYFADNPDGLEKDAIKYAKDIVRKTQFSYDTIDTPVGLSSNIAKTLFQLQTYTTKQLEFLGGMAKGSIKGNQKKQNIIGLLRYAMAGMAFVYTIGKAFGMEPKELLPWYRFDVPPSLKFPVELTKAAINAPDQYGNERSTDKKVSDVAKSALGLIPGGAQAEETYEGLKSIKEGGSFDSAGRMQFKQGQSKAEMVQSILFGKYASNEAKDYFNRAEIKKDIQKPIRKIYDQYQKLIAEGKDSEAQDLIDTSFPNTPEGDANYKIYKDIKSAEKKKATIQGEKEIYPIYLKNQKLKAEGKQDEVDAIMESLTEEEYRVYQLVKEREEE